MKQVWDNCQHVTLYLVLLIFHSVTKIHRANRQMHADQILYKVALGELIFLYFLRNAAKEFIFYNNFNNITMSRNTCYRNVYYRNIIISVI